MAYRFAAGDRSVQRAVRRMAREQIEGALKAIATESADKATHEVRKTCKKLRALLRLIRPIFAAYAHENAKFRDIARLLAGSREDKVMLDTFDLLAADAAGPEDVQAFAAFRPSFARDLAYPMPGKAGAASLDQVRKRLEAEREEVEGWVLEDDGWGAIGVGLRRILKQGRKASRTVMREPTALHYHELRKLMKYHWYHTRMLSPIWSRAMEARAAELSDLADLLGLHHDICVFEGRLGSSLPHAESAGTARVMLGLADRRRIGVEREIGPLVARLLAQKPRLLSRHWRALWRIWYDPADAEAASERL